jgi:Cytochrome C'
VFLYRSLRRLPKICSLLVIATTALVVTGVAATIVDTAKPSGAAAAPDIAAAAEDVVKSIDVSDAAAFKKAADDLPRKGAVIALLATAVSESNGDVKWKPSALAVRDAAMNLAKAKGQPAADKALKEIKSLLDSDKPVDGQPMKYLDITTLEIVMKEVNERNKSMTKNLKGTNFAKNKEAIARDATVWAVLAGVARTDTKSAEKAKKPQADFEKFADEFFTQAKNLAEAAAKGDQATGTSVSKLVKKACADCHAVYRPDIE